MGGRGRIKGGDVRMREGGIEVAGKIWDCRYGAVGDWGISLCALFWSNLSNVSNSCLPNK